MKEYQSTTGGRHAYNTDFKNLQELALAMQEIFRECGSNFVISGCNVTVGDTISVSEGYVYVGNKICKVAAASGLQASNLYIVAKQRNGDSIPYADGNTDIQYIEYYAEVINSSSVNDAHITYDSTSKAFPNLATAFFNYYSVCKKAGSQSINDLTVQQSLTVLKQLLAPQGLSLNNSGMSITKENNEVCINNGDYSLCFSNTGVVTFKYKQGRMFSFANASGSGLVTFESVTIQSELRTKKLYIDGINLEDKLVPLGTIQMWAGPINKIPSNYKLCNGDSLLCADYPALYNIIGNTFNGAPNANNSAWSSPGTGRFRLPDLRGRFIAGYNSINSDYNAIARTGGAAAVKLTSSQSGVGYHNHWYAVDDEVQNITNYGLSGYVELNKGPAGHGSGGVGKTSNTYKDANQAHENRPPFYVLAYIIRVK